MAKHGLNPEIIEALGRHGDTVIGHLTPGERVIPEGIIDDDLEAALEAAFEKAGIDMDAFTVNDNPSINPFTGFQEFFNGDSTGEGESGQGGGGDDDGGGTGGSGGSGGDAAGEDAAAEGVGGGTGTGGAAAVGGEGGTAGAGIAGAQADVAADAAAEAQAEEDAFGGMFGTGGFGDTGFLGQTIVTIPNPLDPKDPFTITPFDIMKTIALTALPMGTPFGLAVKGLEALGFEGIDETADEAVAGQEAATADGGDAGEGSIFEQTQERLSAFSSAETETGDIIGNEFLDFIEEFLNRRVFDFNFADMPDFSILSDDFGSLKSLDFSFPDDGDSQSGLEILDPGEFLSGPDRIVTR